MSTLPVHDALCGNERNDDSGQFEPPITPPIMSAASCRVLVLGSLTQNVECLLGLRELGWALQLESDPQAALRMALEQRADVMLLDSDPNGALDGLAFCRELRRLGGNLAVVALGSSDTLTARVAAIDAGVDDFLGGRGLSLEELHGRLTVAVRVRERRNSSKPTSQLVDAGPIQVNLADEAVRVHGRIVHLPLHQRALIIRLASAVERVVSREELCDAVGMIPGIAFKNLHNEVFRLRARLGPEAAAHLRSVRSLGYVLSAYT